MCTQAICTVCSKPVDTHDKTCPHCNDGEPLNYRVIETKKCPQCCSLLNVGQKKCPQCGTQVEE